MKILGIETSCDETAVAVLEATGRKMRVLSNVVSSQVQLHAQYGGVVPSLAAREHAQNIGHVFTTALQKANIKNIEKEIDCIAVTRGPGLAPALLVGLTFARTLSWLHNKPLIGVDHMEGHIYSNWLERTKNITFPALNVVVSGGHTELVLMKNHGDYQIIGETLDDAVGEAFDKVARLLDLGYPGGPVISRLAVQGNPETYPLPRPMLHSKNYDFSYSGLKTAVLYLLRDLKKKGPITDAMKQDIAASFQAAAIDVILAKASRAARAYHVKSILLSGGVSANRYLRDQLSHLAKSLNLAYAQPPMEYTGDNAAMIAAAGYYRFQNKKNKTDSYESVQMDPNLTL